MHNPHLRKNPSPNHRPNQPNQNIANTPKPAPPRHLSRQPTRQQPNQQPPNQSPLPLHNHHPLRQSNHPQHSNHRHPSPTSSLFSAHSALNSFLFAFHQPALSLPNGSLIATRRLLLRHTMQSPQSQYQIPAMNPHHLPPRK